MYEIPFYTLELPKSAQDEIREIYGHRKVSENIINMYNEHLKFRMYRSRNFYDYEVMASSWFYQQVKDPNISQPNELSRWMDIRTFQDGTEFKKREAKHYRFKPDFLRKHGLVITRNWMPIPQWDKTDYSPTSIEQQTNRNINKVNINLNLLSMSYLDIEYNLTEAASDRFLKKTKVQDDQVICFHKRCDFELTFRKDDYELYKHWELKIGAYRIYNSLVKFTFGDRLAKINPTNNRLDHRLLELPKECLRFIRVDGEHLIEFDLKNSQPCLLMNVLFGNLHVPFKDFQIILKLVKTEHDSLVKLMSSDPKLNELIKSTYKGTFYEALQRLNKESITRDEAKKATMFVLFSGFKTFGNNSVDIWMENFPELYKFIKNLKRSFYKAYKDDLLIERLISSQRSEKTAYNLSKSFLPVLLQKIEALIFLDNILKNIYRKRIFSLSKHDAIICKESDSQVVKKIMEQNLIKILGKNRFTLDTTHLCAECLKLAA